MKLLFIAASITVAAPVMAQNSAPSNPHTAHTTAQAPAQAASPSADAAHAHGKGDHIMMMDAKKMQEHCAKLKASGQKMDGCDQMGVLKSPSADPHAGHKMGQQK